MRKTIILCSSTLVLFSLLSFVSISSHSNANDPGLNKIMEVAYLWELLDLNYEPQRERDQTWLEVGFRSKYAMAKRYASLTAVEEAFGVPVFVRGPHKGEMDFNNTTTFGYYNPDFVTALSTQAKAALDHPMFRPVLKQLYQEKLSSMAHTYRDAYLYLNQDAHYLQDLMEMYLKRISQPEGTLEGSMQEEFRAFAERLESEKGADVYEGFTAPAFWVRRSIDGTGDQIYQLLDFLINELEN